MKSMGKLFFLTTIVLLMLGIMVFFSMQFVEQKNLEAIASMSQFIEGQKWPFTVFRVCLLAMVFWQWVPLMNALARRNEWDDEVRLRIIDARWKVLGWFVLFEVIVIQNSLGYIFQ